MQSKTESLRTRGAGGVKSQSESKSPEARIMDHQQQGETDALGQAESKFTLLCLFIPFRPSKSWMMLTWVGAKALLYSVY